MNVWELNRNLYLANEISNFLDELDISDWKVKLHYDLFLK